MIVLLAVAIGTGIVTAALLMPIGVMTAILVAPLAASLAVALAGLLMAWRITIRDRSQRALDAQTRAMVAALRSVVQRTEKTSPAPKVPQRRHNA